MKSEKYNMSERKMSQKVVCTWEEIWKVINCYDKRNLAFYALLNDKTANYRE